jgi:hypothetical protein
MCSNYLPVTRQYRLLTFFGVEYTKEELLQREAFPLSGLSLAIGRGSVG